MQRRSGRPWLYVFTGLTALLGLMALVRDPFDWGQRGAANDQPFMALLGFGILMAGLIGGSWTYSDFRYRTPVALLQLALDFGVLILIATGARGRITVWDTVEDLAWLLTAGLQAFGAGRDEKGADASRHGSSSSSL